jgi:hypothetical protein
MDLIQTYQNKTWWNTVVKELMDFLVLVNSDEFIDQRSDYQLIRKNSYYQGDIKCTASLQIYLQF